MNHHGTTQASSDPAPDYDADRVARVALSLIAPPGHPWMAATIRRIGAPAALTALLDMRGNTRELHPPGPPFRVRLPRNIDPHRAAAACIGHAQRNGIRLLTPASLDWPNLEPDVTPPRKPATGEWSSPPCWWAQGPLPVAGALTRAVAVLGSRDCTSHGIDTTTQIVRALARRRWIPLTGGGHGVAAAAHRAALKFPAPSVAILPGGIDCPYPPGNNHIFAVLADRGLLLSPWPPGALMTEGQARISNRLVAVAARAGILVEALPTDRAAVSLMQCLASGKPGLVVAPPFNEPRHTAGSRLLQAGLGARLAASTSDILTQLSSLD